MPTSSEYTLNAPNLISIAVALVLVAHVPARADVPTPFDPDDYRRNRHTLYVDANITTGNAVLAYDIQPDGSLHASGPFSSAEWPDLSIQA